MMKIAMSGAGAGLLRALIAKAGLSRDAVRIEAYSAIDWQSLTMVGERHDYALRVAGCERLDLVRDLLARLGEEEFAVPGQIVADICGMAAPSLDGTGLTLRIEALTIEE